MLPSAHLKVADVFLVSGSQNDKVGLLHLKVLCLAVICIAGCANVGVLQDRATTLYRECRGAGDQSKPVSCHASVRQSLAAAKFCDRRWPIRGPVKSAFVSMQGLMCCLQCSTQPGGAQKEGTCCHSVPVEHYAMSGTQMGALETETNMGDCCPMAGGASPAHCFCRKSCQGSLSQRCGQYCPLHPRRHRHPCSAEPAARHPAEDWPLHHLAGQCKKVCWRLIKSADMQHAVSQQLDISLRLLPLHPAGEQHGQTRC